MKRLTWRVLAEDLGRDPSVLFAAVAAAEPPPPPLLSRLMAGFGAWTASCFLVGSVATCVGLHLDAEDSLAPIGAVTVALAVGLRRWRSSPNAVFVEQVALVLLATGLATFGAGVEAVFDEGRLTSAAVAAMALAVAVVYPDPFSRSWLAAVAISGLGIAIASDRNDSALPIVLTVLALAVAAGAVYAGRHALTASSSHPFLRGALVALAGWSWIFLLENERWQGWTSAALGVAGAAAVLALGRGARVVGVGVVLALLLAFLQVPGVLVGALAATAAVWMGDRVILGLATAYTVGMVCWYYYDFDAELWTKAGALAAAGLGLLLARAVLLLGKEVDA